jgi:hypothetical protein
MVLVVGGNFVAISDNKQQKTLLPPLAKTLDWDVTEHAAGLRVFQNSEPF